jgi:hypothetical protein
MVLLLSHFLQRNEKPKWKEQEGEARPLLKEQPFMQIISSSTDIENRNPKPSFMSDKPLKPKPKRKPK